MKAKKPTKKRKRKGAGRPKGKLQLTQHPTCKLTPQIIDDFCAIVAKGNWRRTACQRLNISMGTYDKWISVGKKQVREVETGKRKTLLLQGHFLLALEQAEGVVHGQMVEDILEHGSIQARQWYLERRFHKLYSRNPAAHIDDETGKEVRIDAAAVLAEKLKALVGE